MRSLAAWSLAMVLAAEASARLPFRIYQTSDGVPQSQVMALAQDDSGEIWLGTWCGAARYDGAEFHSLTERTGLSGNYVYDIVTDPDGRVWLAGGTGIVGYAPRRPEAPAIRYAPLLDDGEERAVRDLFVDSGGRLWAVLDGGRVARRDGAAFTILTSSPANDDILQAIAEDDDGRMLLATENGIELVGEASAARFRSAPGPWQEPARLVAALTGGRIAFATPQALYLTVGAAPAGAMEIRGPQGESIAGARFVLEDRGGRLWIATGHGVVRRDRDGRTLRIMRADGLPNELVHRLLEDREGNLWIGTDSGLAKYLGDIFESRQPTFGGATVSAWSFAESTDGRMLIGTDRGLLTAHGDQLTLASGPGGEIRALVDAGADGLFVGTRDHGLARLRNGSWRRWRAPELPGDRVYTIHRSPNGDLWIGTRNGLARLRGDELRAFGRNDGMAAETVWRIVEDGTGNLLVATDRGVVRLEGERFVRDPAFAPLEPHAVRCLALDAKGDLWAGTNGHGLWRRHGDSWTTLTTEQGLADNFVWGLVADRQGGIWAATNRGIDRYLDGRWSHFSIRDGLPANEIALGAAYEASDGSIWFGFPGGDGWVRFAPDPPIVRGLPPLIRIVKADTGRRHWREPTAALALGADEHDVTLSYIGVSFIDEQAVVYQFHLAPYDEGWSPPSRSRSVRYTNLAPGSYRFFVRAAGPGGIWSASPAVLDFTVRPPWWRTWWFRFLVATAALLVTAFAFRQRLRRERRQTERLEGLVQERTRALEEKMAMIAELKETFERLSVTDSLTGLANRRAFAERMEGELERARRHGEALGLAMIDLDHFKSVNDRFGHQVGDQVLVGIARELEAGIRRSDLVARWGGEEFVVAFLHSDLAGCRQRVEELRRRVAARRFEVEGAEIVITLSAGLVWWQPTDGPPRFEDLVRTADRRLYRAKDDGRDRVVAADPS